MSHCLPVCKPGHWANQLPEEAYLLECVCATAQEVKLILFTICISFCLRQAVLHNACLKLCGNSQTAGLKVSQV